MRGVAQTANLKSALRIFGRLANTQRPEKTAIISGKRGLGKSTSLQYLAKKHNGIYLYCLPTYTPNGLLDDLFAAAHAVPPDGRSTTKLLRAFCEYLKNTGRPLFLDNCDDICKGILPSIVRTIQDKSEQPIVMVGMERLPIKLARYPELLDRAHMAEFRLITRPEIDLLVTATTDISIDTELLDAIHRESRGRVRRATDSIDLIAEFAKRTGSKSISRADWGDQELVVSGDPQGD